MNNNSTPSQKLSITIMLQINWKIISHMYIFSQAILKELKKQETLKEQLVSQFQFSVSVSYLFVTCQVECVSVCLSLNIGRITKITETQQMNFSWISHNIYSIQSLEMYIWFIPEWKKGHVRNMGVWNLGLTA